MAELQRDYIVEGTLAGLVAARAEGKYPGRRCKLDPETVLEAQRHIVQYGTPRTVLAERLGVSRMTSAAPSNACRLANWCERTGWQKGAPQSAAPRYGSRR